MEFIWLVVGLIALVAGAELLVRGASRLAASFGISSLIIGLTVVAFGTSAPEMAVSVKASLSGRADISLGNVVGSNIFNVLFILGISAIVVPLVVDQKLVRFDVPLMIGVSVLVLLFGLDQSISRLEGGLLFAGLLSYTAWCVVSARRELPAIRLEYDHAFETDGAADAGSGSPEVRRSTAGHFLWQLALIAAGLALLVIGADRLVDAATVLARRAGVSELIIGLTIVAAGTSLPELATSIVAAARGERDIAVGNVVGSNLFNLLGVLGLAALISPDGVAVAPQAIQFDLPVMVAVAAACLPVFFTGHLIARWEGLLFLACGVAYTTALVLMATGSQALPTFQLMMTGFAVPLTVITLLVGAIRTLRQRRPNSATQVDRSPEQQIIPMPDTKQSMARSRNS
ncbi:MAG: calcium/sodium antiporter [Planctomycetaceae bacterium]